MKHVVKGDAVMTGGAVVKGGAVVTGDTMTERGMKTRVLLWTLLPVELGVLAAALAGVAVAPAALAGFVALLLGTTAVESALFVRLYARARLDGAAPRPALRTAAGRLVPRVVRRLTLHEVRSVHSIWLWVRRRRHGVGADDHAAGYDSAQAAMMWSWVGLSVVETVALAWLIPWPLVHAITLYLGLYGMVVMVGILAACVARPHVVGADGSLRLRYGALFDLRIPAEDIVRVRLDRRFPDAQAITPRADGSLDLVVGGQTTLSVELAAPIPYARPLGKTGTAHTIRFHADDPQALLAALEKAERATG
ncbi:hypothetical protein ACH41E_11360 [Streptomyces sp. NPDC020412]|uniref:hypothetical protein n=1 Tax=Streptomyces sp. NPDC020412 TaxID=3365073 RepID=UPI00379B985B